MTAAAERVPSTEQVHKQISTHQGNDWSDVSRSLSIATDHRPLQGQAILDRATKDLVAKGIIPDGSHLLAPAGDDFRVQNKDGSVDVYNAKNMSQHHQDAAAGAHAGEIGGRKSSTQADGSGTVQAKGDDRYSWNLAHDVLKSQGVNNPSNREMANWEMQFMKENHLHSMKDVKPGHEYKIPAQSVTGSDMRQNTQFAGENAQAKYDEATKPLDQAKAAFDKFGTDRGPFGWGGHYLDKDQITKALQRSDLSADDKAGLQFLQANFDKLKINNFGTNDFAVSADSLTRVSKEVRDAADRQRMLDIRNQD